MNTPFSIRVATVADAAGIAFVNHTTWKSSFRGLVPDAHLEGLNLEVRTQNFLKRLGEPDPMFVAEAAGRIVGFADGRATSSPEYPFAGELHAIYVLQEWQGRGVGRALVRSVLGRMDELGFTSMIVWTFEQSPFRRFYESLGAVPVPGARYERDFSGTTLAIVGFGWPALDELRRRLG